MNVRPWTPVNLSGMAGWKQQKIHGVTVEVALSPYDIPQAIRRWVDEKTKSTVFEFRYLTEERSREQKPVEGVTLSIGENSGRIYRLEIDSKLAKGSPVSCALRIEEVAARAIDTFAREALPEMLDIYSLNKRALQEEAGQITDDDPSPVI